ncbi:MAG: DUF4124 domain-containing protein [Desulfobacterales bacterium]
MVRNNRKGIRGRPGICLLLWVLAVWCATAVADDQGAIYMWIDDNGVRHFSNVKPNAEGESVVKTTEEIPHDPEADQIRESSDRQRQRERELESLQYQLQEAETARKRAEREAEEATARAERLGLQLDDALEESDRNNSRVVYPYYWERPRPPHHRPGDRPPRPRPPIYRPERPERPDRPIKPSRPDRVRPRPVPGERTR